MSSYMNKNIIIEDLFQNNKVKEFCLENNLTSEDILNNIVELSMYKEAMDICSGCNGKAGCGSNTENMTVTLEYNDGVVKARFVECEIANKMNPSNFEVMYYSEKQEQVIINDKRSKVFLMMKKFIDEYDNSKFNKGLYIYGPYGTGKSFLAYQFAQQLTQKGIKVIFAYYPDLVRKIKSLIGSSEMEQLINKIKKVEVLFLDDLGAENNTAFIRDDILSPILQYRMNNDLATFVTSNCNLEELYEHFSETNAEKDDNKAGRIIDRLRYLTNTVELKDINYRNKK